VNATPYYPVFLDLHDRRCVVFGDNALAEEKALGLRSTGADVVHLRRPFQTGDLSGAYLAIDASDDPQAQRAAREEADRERVLLNVADVTHQCDWIAPALVRRGPLQIAISTSGQSPFLARALRERLETTFGDEWGPFTALLGGMRRRLRRAGVSGDAQQRAYRQLMRSGATGMLREGDERGAAAIAVGIEQAAHATPRTPPTPMGEVVLAGAGPGDPDLVTLGARAVLADADVVFHDALVGPTVLRLCGPRARLVDAGKRSGRRSAAQADINAAMIDAARAGELVVRLKGGDPFLFGRGGEEVEALRRAGVPVRVIPGVSAALAAPAAAGIPLTHRGVAASVAFVTGHRAGGELTALEDLARSVDTLVVLMPAELDSIARRLAAALGPDRPAAIVSKATTPEQQVIRAPIGGIAAAARAAGVRPPSTLVVGDVVDVGADTGTLAFASSRAFAGALAASR
jgi:uroporphyrin-III C-methyltransferase/precorrin-2 dehydrogenase/sirohydrochlorin ferrochelatase